LQHHHSFENFSRNHRRNSVHQQKSELVKNAHFLKKKKNRKINERGKKKDELPAKEYGRRNPMKDPCLPKRTKKNVGGRKKWEKKVAHRSGQERPKEVSQTRGGDLSFWGTPTDGEGGNKVGGGRKKIRCNS